MFDVLINKIRAAVFAVGDDKKKAKERKGRYTKSQDPRHYISARPVSRNVVWRGLRAEGTRIEAPKGVGSLPSASEVWVGAVPFPEKFWRVLLRNSGF